MRFEARPNLRYCRVATTNSQLSDDTHVVKQLLYGFDFASRFDEVKLRENILRQLHTKPIALVADSYDTVLCGSLATAELVRQHLRPYAWIETNRFLCSFKVLQADTLEVSNLETKKPRV